MGIGPTHALSNFEIDDICTNLFTNLKYKGCYASDKKPKLNNYECCILNTDDSKGPGEHWVSLCKSNGRVIIYDSFGRESNDMSNNFANEWVETNKNIEQGILEMNCGYRCIVWLICSDIFGSEFVKEII